MIFRDFCGFLGGLGGDIFVAVLFGSIFWVAGTVIGGGVLGYFAIFLYRLDLEVVDLWWRLESVGDSCD